VNNFPENPYFDIFQTLEYALFSHPTDLTNDPTHTKYRNQVTFHNFINVKVPSHLFLYLHSKNEKVKEKISRWV